MDGWGCLASLLSELVLSSTNLQNGLRQGAVRAGLGTRREEENFNKDNIWNQFDSIITLSIYSNYIKIIINLSQEVMTDSLPSVPVVVRGVGAELARAGADLTRLSRR